MRILLTGATSFTGAWFARELAGAGHEVVATLRRAPEAYAGVRGERAALVAGACTVVPGVEFGDERFLDAAADGPYDVLCHHAARVEGYRRPDYPVAAAVAEATRRLDDVLDRLRRGGLRAVVLTGTVFEAGEGGDAGSDAVLPYGHAKTLTAERVAEACRRAAVPLARVVLGNPFGPLEEERFTTALARAWRAGRTPEVRTPAYVRDNVHVSLLARAYRAHVEAADRGATIRPSQYREPQGAFAERFAREVGPRLGVPAPLRLLEQTAFPEPRVRVNSDPLGTAALGWDEAAAWDELARWYAGLAPAEAA